MKFSKRPIPEEILDFVAMARKLAADYKARGINPTFKMPDGTLISLLDPEQDELMDQIEAIAKAQQLRRR